MVFFLLAEDAGALLETVRSRAPTHRLAPIESAAMHDFLLSDKAAQEAGSLALYNERPLEFEALISLAGGSIGRALTLLNGTRRAPLMERRARVEELLTALSDRTTPDRLLLSLLSLGDKRDAVSADLAMLKLALRDLVLLSRAEGVTLLFFTEREAAAELSARFTATRLLAIADAAETATDALGANANVRLTIINLFNHLST